MVLYFTIHAYADTTFQAIFETVTYLLAVVLLTGMTFWMQRHSRTLKKEIVAKATTAGSGFAFGLLAFSTVGREGLESAVFTLAFAFQTNGLLLLLGAALGLLASAGLCVLIYRMGYRLDFRLFFRVMGIVLIFFAAGLLGDAVQNMQSLGWLPFGGHVMWNTGSILSEDTTVGDILHTMLGYSEAPTVLQATLYACYLAVFGYLFWRLTRKPGESARAAATTTSAQALSK